MKNLSYASSNFPKIEFHKPTRNITGSGVQITANINGSINVQIAKQLTEHKNKSAPATYAWTDSSKNIQFMLSADELRDIAELLKKVLSGKARLFVVNQHNPVIQSGRDPGYDNAYFYHSPASKKDKSITFFGKKYNEQLQVEMRVYDSTTKLTLMFSFSEKEVKKLFQLFNSHNVRELEIPNGYKSVITDEKGIILKECYLPPYNKGDMFVINETKYEIFYKAHMFKKNITHYAIRPYKKQN